MADEKDLEAFRPGAPAEEEDFATLLDAGFAGPFKQLSVGDRVQATIVGMGADSILLDVGQRSEGAMARDEFTPDELVEMQIGDVVDVYVAQVARGIRLSRGMRGRSLDLESLAEAAAAGIPVEGRVTGENKGGYDVELPGARGFVPHSQIEAGMRLPPAEYVGRTLRFKVLEVRGRDVVLSRAALQREEQAVEREEMMAQLREGQVRSAVVIKHESFGVFVDLGAGVNALVPRSEVSWSRTEDPEALLPVGRQVSVMILRVEMRDGRPRVSASLRRMDEDPWSAAGGEWTVGRTVRGRVTRLMAFGAFLELAPGIEGLLHVSEMSADKRVRSPGDVVKVGDELDVAIVSADLDQRRIGLSLKALSAREDDVDAATRSRYMDGRPGASATAPEPAGESVMALALRRARERAEAKGRKKG
jgi:small subunit ribosomal protein S1